MNSVMSARLRDYRMLWRAAVTHADPGLSAIARWGMIALVLVFALATTVKQGPGAGLGAMWCAASLLLLLNWAWRFMPGAVKLASPVNAGLVPRMRRRLVELSWLVCCTGIAGIASAPYTNAGDLGGWLFWIVMFVVGSGLGVAGHPAGTAIIAAIAIGSAFIGKLFAALGGLMSHPLVVVLSLPVYAGIILLAIRAMFPQGGERHWNMLARRARWATTLGSSEPLGERIASVYISSGYTMRWYAATLRRASARGDRRDLVLHALGPAHHLGDTVFTLAIIAAVVLALGVLTTLRIDPSVAPGIGWLFACMLLVVPLLYCVRLGHLSARLGAEQALVRLAPPVPPQAGKFNAWLGQSLLRKALTAWGLASGAAVLLAALGGAGPAALLRTASLACMILPVVAVPLRNHASRTQSAAGAAATLLLISLVESVVLGMAVHALTGIPMLPVAALVSICYTVYAVVRGLRTMRHAPCAFPAGRMD